MSKIGDILKAIKPEKITNFRVILLCIFAATIFKFFNSLNGDYSTTLKYPLEFIYDKEQYIAVDELPENVQLNVNGLGWNLFRNSLGIKVTPLQIPLDNPTELKKIPGALIPGFISDQLSEFELNYVLTDTLAINLDFRDGKLFHIRVDSAAISLEKDYRIAGPIVCKPDTVRLSGPRAMLSALPDTITVSLPDSNIEGDYDEDVVINIPNSQLINRNPATVNVLFSTQEYTNVQQKIDMDKVGFPSETPLSLDIIAANVSYDVPIDNQSKIDLDQFKIILDYRKMSPVDSTIIPELISFPEGISNVEMDSLRVKVVAND